MNDRATDVNDLKGSEVRDRDGAKLGTLESVHLDPRTQEPAWGLVNLGGLRSSRRFVSLRGVRHEDDGLRLDAARGAVEDAPDAKAGAVLTQSEEERLTRHYGEWEPEGGRSRRRARPVMGRRGRDEQDADHVDRDDRDDRDDARLDRDADTARRRERRPAPSQRHEGAGLAAAAERYRGVNWGASFFGWLVAVGIAALLVALVAAAGAAVGLTDANASDITASADTVSVVGGALLLAILLIAYYAGGYVAGRMSRFDGAQQGIGTWLIGLIVTLLLGAAGAIFGSQYNVLEQLKLPRIPIDEGSLTTGGVIALVAVILGTLLAAVAGGRVGRRYHDKVDAAAFGP